MNQQKVKHHIAHPAEVGQDAHPQLQGLQIYTYTLAANASVQIPAQNQNFFILSATGTLGVWGDTFGHFDGLTYGQGLNNVPFNRLILSDQSGESNTIKILLSPGQFTNQILQSIVSINSAQVLQLIRPEISTGNYKSSNGIAANTPDVIFTPAANLNGALVLSASFLTNCATGFALSSLIAKSSAPASTVDGEVILCASNICMNGSAFYEGGSMPNVVQIPAGVGLYFITALATAAAQRAVRYKLL